MAVGDHLHLEIFVHGQSVDPMGWFDAKWIRDSLATKLEVPSGSTSAPTCPNQRLQRCTRCNRKGVTHNHAVRG